MTEYRTNDLGLAAAALAKGEVPQVEMDYQGRGTFVFENEKKLLEYEQRWWDHTFLIDAPTYFSAIKTLKSRLSMMK